MSFLVPSVPSMSAQPVTPQIAERPNVTDIQKGIADNEALGRKPKGRQANILTGALGDTSLQPGAKTLLG